MKYFFITLSIVSLLLSTREALNAASFTVNAPERSSTSGDPFSVVVTLNTEGETVSGVSGSLSFDERLFSVDSISTDSSVVTPWISFPRVSLDRYFDNRTHITFEGIFAGGFGGVQSAYYKGSREGKLFTITLRPKSTGETTLVLDSLSLRSFSESASEIPVNNVIKKVVVPSGTKITPKREVALQRVDSKNLSVVVSKSDLIANGALHLVIDDRDPHSAITGIYVAEATTYDGDMVDSSDWRSASNPYILLSQDRSKYVHVKVVYSDDTYAIKTIEPVDNTQTSNGNSHILLVIGMLIVALCLYGYARKYKIIHPHTT